MITQPIKLPALLSMSVRPIRLWIVERALINSSRDLEVLQQQRQQLYLEEREMHEKQVRLVAERAQLVRQ